jgi:hypothetical protein
MVKTDNGLVENAKHALTEKWGYVYGTYGHVLTPKLLEEKRKQYPDNIEKYYEFIVNNYLNQCTVDCVGLIKSYLWLNDDCEIVYNSKTDLSADGMFEAAKEKENVWYPDEVDKVIPEILGLCVWKKGHIGIYIGKGEVIEARGTMYGVVKTKLNDRPWTHWLKCPFIEYIDPEQDLWKFDGIEALNKYGLLNDIAYWSSRIDDAMPVWAVTLLLQRIYEDLKGGQNK